MDLLIRELLPATLLGLGSCLLAITSYRFQFAWLAWFALTPLALAVYLFSPGVAAFAGFVCGALAIGLDRQASVPGSVRGARWIEAGSALGYGLLWAIAFGAAAWLWPDGVPAWGALLMPAAAVLLATTIPFGLLVLSGPLWARRPPYYCSWFLGSQSGALPVVHIARLGGDLSIPALLALSATLPVMLLVDVPPTTATLTAAVLSIVVLASALAAGFISYRRAVRKVRTGELVRVAAVAYAPGKFDFRPEDYRNVGDISAQYSRQIASAIRQGAQLIVLPEAAVLVDSTTRKRWLDAIASWACEAHAPVVAGVFDEDLKKNQVLIADETGRIAVTYDKQHPTPGLEPPPAQRTGPALLEHEPGPISAVTCVDLDFADQVKPIARASGILAVPANDWREIVSMHHRSAVWTAVMAGVPVVRSAGHGISSIYDPAGRIVAQASSEDGPVVLVGDVPIALITMAKSERGKILAQVA